MNVLFLYGPPGVGKYTISRLISQKLGYGLLHNHLTVDFVSGIFPFGSAKYRKLNKELRVDMLKAALRNRVRGLVMTYAFALNKREDWKEVEGFRRTVVSRGGHFFFVELRCDSRTLFRRIARTDRRHFQKITSPRKLKELLSSHQFHSSDRYPANAATRIFDTTTILPTKTATMIIDSLHLR